MSPELKRQQGLLERQAAMAAAAADDPANQLSIRKQYALEFANMCDHCSAGITCMHQKSLGDL
eukprot:COSAG05_NODE_975_length_6350_cov_6.983523_9_plen_63_part_00